MKYKTVNTNDWPIQMKGRIPNTPFAPANTAATFNIVASYSLLRHVNTSLLLLGISIQHLSGFELIYIQKKNSRHLAGVFFW